MYSNPVDGAPRAFNGNFSHKCLSVFFLSLFGCLLAQTSVSSNILYLSTKHE
jgi:hypothetical protein